MGSFFVFVITDNAKSVNKGKINHFANKQEATDLLSFTAPKSIVQLNGGRYTDPRSEVRKIRRIQLGRHLIDTWYFSPYPLGEKMGSSSSHEDLFLCPFCLDYKQTRTTLLEHRCFVRNPPGKIIYKDPIRGLAMWEVDGRAHSLYCQRLCLLSMLFLKTKQVYQDDVEHFLFYVLCEYSENAHPHPAIEGAHIVGFFSKEKNCLQGYNVACILTLPPYQRNGYGRLLINISYELSKREGNSNASPEKPLSDLGKLAYRKYWVIMILSYLIAASAPRDDAGVTAEIETNESYVEKEKVLASRRGTLCFGQDLESLLQTETERNLPVGISIADLQQRTGICLADIYETLFYMTDRAVGYGEDGRLMTFSKGAGKKPAILTKVILKESIVSSFLKHADTYWTSFCDPTCLAWKPSTTRINHSNSSNGLLPTNSKPLEY